MTKGEAQVVRALGLPCTTGGEAFLWWHEPVLRGEKDSSDRTPDFVIVDKAYGVLVLEVKDWAIEQILQADLHKWSVRKGGVVRSETAPVEQARVASHVLMRLLEGIPELTQTNGTYQGKLKIPVEYGAVLPNITRAQAASQTLLEVVRDQNYWFRDDLGYGVALVEGALSAALRSRLRPRFSFQGFTSTMLKAIEDTVQPLRQINIIPSLRSDAEVLAIDRLNAEQDQYARALGEGHRVLTGCAGSGKTLVVAARARFLKQAFPGWRVHIICYNAELVPHITRLLTGVDTTSEMGISICNFHAYARKFLEGKLQREEGESEASFAERTADSFVKAAGDYPDGGAFDALLIDEGQDLRPEWTNAMVGLVNRATNSVLFCASRQQNIYGITSYKNMGINAEGRTKHLRQSYRCSTDIIALAEVFKPDAIQKRKYLASVEGQNSLFTFSERGSRRPPQFVACSDPSVASKYILDQITQLIRAGQCDFRDIAILYTDRFLPLLEPLSSTLCSHFGDDHVFAKWKAGWRLMPDSDSIKMTTIHSAKGLEWRIVFVLGMDKLPRPNIDEERERSLAYVALTRAGD